MHKTIDHYHFLLSPWAYLAIARLNTLRERADIRVNSKPIDPMKTFDLMGGTPPSKRHPSRQRFRMDELKRWSAHLNIPMNFTPKYFPADQTLAAQMIYAAGGAEGSAEAGKLSDMLLTAVWNEDRNIADEPTLLAIANMVGLDGEDLLARAKLDDSVMLYQRTTAEAHNRDVFGSPTYVISGENFWGQDRLDFLERYLAE